MTLVILIHDYSYYLCICKALNKVRRNISVFILSFVLLTSGNFAFAVSHLECIGDEAGHHKCEMECCQKDDCCTGEGGQKAVEIKDENGSCCEVHIEKSMEQDITLPVITAGPEKNNIEFIVLTLKPHILNSQFFPVIIHKLKTTNIFLTISNLRI